MCASIVRSGVLVMVFVCFACFVGCDGAAGTKAPAELIIGKWKHAGHVNEQVEFIKGGAVVFSDGKGDLPPIRGTYALSGDQIDIVINDAQAKQTDDGDRYFAPSWLAIDQMKDMMDHKAITAHAGVTVTPQKLTLKFGESMTEYVPVQP